MEIALREEMALRRIAATLVAMAALAERAAGLSFPLRWLVLAILCPAEAVARTFVVETTRSTCFDAPVETGSSPLGAAWLALRFRALAAALGALLRLACRFHGRNNTRHIEPAPLAPQSLRLLARPGGWRQKAADTS